MTTSPKLQEQLFAELPVGGTKRVLLILQAMDTAGKGGIVTHVMGAMNPQGVQTKSLKRRHRRRNPTISSGGSRRKCLRRERRGFLTGPTTRTC